MALIECGHGQISVASNGTGTCDICGDKVEMESVSLGAGQRPFFWQKTKPSDRTSAHPANRSDHRETRPGHYEPI